MKRLATLTFQYYQLLLLYNIALTVCGAFLFAVDAHGLNTGIFLPAKLIGFGSAVALHYYSSNKSYYYFRNAGYSMRRIYLGAFIFDISIYFILITLTIVCLP